MNYKSNADMEVESQLRDQNAGEWQHFRRVEALSALMARAIGWDDEPIVDLRLAALYHHLDHSRIPQSTLSEKATDFLGRFNVRQMDEYRWHGSSMNTTADEAANIIAIADRYDRLTSDQHYRSALSDSEAIDLLAFDAETDSEVYAVEALRRAFGEEEEQEVYLPKAA